MSRQAIRITANGLVEPLAPGGQTPHGSPRAIFLVHGFNNDPTEAGKSFSAMRRGIDLILDNAGYDTLRRREVQRLMWEVHWPGYRQFEFLGERRTQRNGWERAATALEYSRQVRKARSWVAYALERYCSALGPVNVSFVAHSLGCRVVLETINRLSGRLNSLVRCSGALLMAGAVAVHELASSRLGGAVAALDHRFCFYSPSDLVLRFAFPPGQIMAGEPASYYLWPVATGLTGKPRELWSQSLNTGFGHGDYWSGALSLPTTAGTASVMRGLFLARTDSAPPANAVRQWPQPRASAPLKSLPPVRQPPGANWLEEFCAADR